MSQEKVARYKEEKANRKVTMRKQKRAAIMRTCVAGAVLAAALVWVVWSGVESHKQKQLEKRDEVNINYTAVGDYIDALTTEDSTGDLIGNVEEGAEVTTDANADTNAEKAE